MKPHVHTMTALCAAGLIAFGVRGADAQDTPASSQPLVITIGHAVIRAAPDHAFVLVAAESRARNPQDAQRQNADAMAAVLQKLQQARVPADAIHTAGYDLQPEFDYVNGRPVPRGYVARNTIDIRVEDLARLGEIIDLAVGSGATSVSSVRFDLKNRDTLERNALKQAVADARARADAAAAGAGRTIDRVLRIEEARGPEVVRSQMRLGMSAEAVSATPIVPADVEVRAQVSLTAILK